MYTLLVHHWPLVGLAFIAFIAFAVYVRLRLRRGQASEQFEEGCECAEKLIDEIKRHRRAKKARLDRGETIAFDHRVRDFQQPGRGKKLFFLNWTEVILMKEKSAVHHYRLSTLRDNDPFSRGFEGLLSGKAGKDAGIEVSTILTELQPENF